jgi:hypothetical protein
VKLLKLRSYQDRWYYVSSDDWQRYKTQVPTRCKTGRRHMDLPRGRRPDCVTIHRHNVVEVLEGPDVDYEEPFRAYLTAGGTPC